MAIVGGSVIGLATALKAASAGFTVTVYDPSLSWANSAGWCAGGMLGGITEAWPGEDEQLVWVPPRCVTGRVLGAN